MRQRGPHRHPRPRRRALGRAATICTVAAALVIAPITAAHAASAPDYLTDPLAEPGIYSIQNLGADRTDENFFYRIPTLAHLGDGVVLAAWDARPGGAGDAPNPNSIIQRRSTDNGQTWGPLQIIAAGAAADADNQKHGYSDPSYVVDGQSGRVFAFFVYSKDQGFGGSAYGNDDADRQVISAAVIHSDDQGHTWSEPDLITDVVKPANGTTTNGTYTPAPGDVKGTFATSGGGIQLHYGEHAGRLVQQFAGTVRQADGSTVIQAYSVYSDDHGQTWQRGEFVGSAMDENKVVELSDGRVMLNSRDSSNGHLRKVAISEDGGATYGPVTVDPQLPDPTNNATITRLHPDAAEGSADAQKLLFTNSNNGANGNRVNGAVRLSCDDGKTWPGLRTLNPGFFGYSSAVALDEGRIGVLWEGNYTDSMQLSTLDEPWLNAVCVPLAVPETTLEPGVAGEVPVTVTNQEQNALTGSVSFFTGTGWTASSAEIADLAPGASTTVTVAVTAPADAAGPQRLQAAFTAADGRVSQATAVLQLPRATTLGATLTSTNTSPARDVVSEPYRAGDVLSFSLRVTSTSDEVTTVTPADSTFTAGFAPNACRWRNLAAFGAYNCTTPRHTLSDTDIERGWYAPEYSMSVTAASDPATAVTVSHTGTPVVLRDGVLGATITGQRSDTGRDLAASPYTLGEHVPYAFRVDSTSPVTTAVVPTAGDFAPFVPPGSGNCRYLSLAAFAGYDCATPRHTVTQEDLDRGFFGADTTWTVGAAGLTTRTVTVDGGEVDVLVRDPKLAGELTPTWQDVNGNAVADANDTVTWARTVTNTGNVALTALEADGTALGTLAVGATAGLPSQTVVLTTSDIAAGEISSPGFDATAANGLRQAAASVEGQTFTLPRAGVWKKSSVYLTGSLVTYDGRLWKATWWTKGEKPGSVTGAWQELASDASGKTVWSATRIFTEGERVSLDGREYVAKWWTRNQRPAPLNLWGPWALVG